MWPAFSDAGQSLRRALQVNASVVQAQQRDQPMKTSTAAIVTVVAGGSLLLAWSLLPADSRPPWASTFRLVVALVAPFALYAAFGPAQPRSTMGPRGDGLIGFEARVTRVEPLQIEAQGTVWQGRAVGRGPIQAGATMHIVGRDGLTLLVEARDAGSTGA